MKPILSLFFALLATVPSAVADSSVCSEFTDAMLASYKIDMKCETLAKLPAYAATHREDKAVSYDDHVSKNAVFVSENIRYRRFGLEGLVRLSRNPDYCVSGKVSSDLLLPAATGQLNGVDELRTAFTHYTDAVTKKEGKPQIDSMKKAFADYWRSGIDALVKKSACGESFCRSMGGLDGKGNITQDCLASFKPTDEFTGQFFDKLKRNAPRPAVEPNPNSPSASIPLSRQIPPAVSAPVHSISTDSRTTKIAH